MEEKKSHAVLDLQSRMLKAQKIDLILNVPRDGCVYRILEIGTGSGGIAHYFATHKELNVNIDSVDVVDCRVVKDGYSFHLVEGCILPFANESYDFVISNHVIEHVGEQQEQSVHIAELNRVLKLGGAAYLAFPNKWMLFEPHYKLPFLSWIPIGWANKYMKLTGRGDNYDCRPLTLGKIELILNNYKWLFENKSAEALKITFFLERPNSGISKLINLIPIGLIKILNSINPTVIYKISK